ncbi:hypothetical protein GCM10022212_28050 [Actimicrobium antarcticum]|uniref:Uncharacterized protein n=2 Tax=Actimicrobium antarcticum TaxID=1051899 RepID=A0ABP7TM34_9BURK
MMRLRDAAFDAAAVAIRDARKRHAGAHQHRALHRVTATPYLIAQAILLPLLFCAVLLFAEPYLMGFWRDCIVFWLTRLDVPLHVLHQTSTIDGLHFEWSNSAAGTYMPSFTMMLGSALVTLLVFFFTGSMSNKSLPLKYLIRIVCVVQGIALLFFWFAPSQFPYTIPDHMRNIISIGYMLMLAIPVMLAIGYYLLHLSLPIKIIHTVFILSYFMLMIPHKVVLHTLILYKMSLLYMPVLYICLGAVFDVLLFVALYSWAVSMLPSNGTD